MTPAPEGGWGGPQWTGRRDPSPVDRTRRLPLHDIRTLAVQAARAADEKKGIDTVILDVGDALSITDYFVITSGANRRQVQTLAEEVEKALKADGGISPVATEGLEDASWVLLDYGAFVVHVFLDETRRFYNLERLWADVPRVSWEPVGAPALG